MKSCIACGMPMQEPSEFALSDTNKDYCVHCARPDGTMQSLEEKLKSMTDFMVRTQGLDAQAARSTARSLMARLPAWQEQLREG
ncbi:putative zinc ribbon domain protein [compost metagenome]|uniref:zinc ribbon domain-containing protein n=1 Tax=unclassified Paenibacillus TaxID=185978 RepID=UPI000F94E346|nr:zinc ribbon domain-containing protein [Paenibacillus sp. J53TS2]GIP50343.1 AraC family transcriptional regulator [Paenibacillus sp. J53TS2]